MKEATVKSPQIRRRHSWLWICAICLATAAPAVSPAVVGATDPRPIVTPHFEQTMLPYVARVYFDKSGNGNDAYYEILKDGKTVYRQNAKPPGEKFFIGTMYEDDPDATSVKMGADITGTGQPALVISEWSGGANCCLTLHLFEIGSTFRKIGAIDAEFGDSGPHFVLMNKNTKNSGLVISINDWTFANWHSDFADSPAPKVLLRYSDGAYRISSDLMRAPAFSPPDLAARIAEVRNYPPSAKGGKWPHAEISPKLWGTMLDLIYSGHAGDAWKFLDSAWPPKIAGKEAFARDFRAQLAKSPYWSAVTAMNQSRNLTDKNSGPPSPAATASPAASK